MKKLSNFASFYKMAGFPEKMFRYCTRFFHEFSGFFLIITGIGSAHAQFNMINNEKFPYSHQEGIWCRFSIYYYFSSCFR